MSIDAKLASEPEIYDIVIEDGDLVLVDGRQEVLQAVTIRLLFILTEWDYNFTLGVPWLTEMFDIRYPLVRKEAHLKETILQTPNVLRITAFLFTVDPIAKGAYVAFTAETSFGPINGEVTV
jgi:hypothetical protein